MPLFSFSKIDRYRQAQEARSKDIIDIKFPSELSEDDQQIEAKELLVFIVDDDPNFMQILNTHFSKLTLKIQNGDEFKFKVKNFATGKSCLEGLTLKPDLIFLNYYINKGLPNALTGKETLDQIIAINPNQKVIILDDLNEKLRGAFIENGLRDYIIQDSDALENLNNSLIDILDNK